MKFALALTAALFVRMVICNTDVSDICLPGRLDGSVYRSRSLRGPIQCVMECLRSSDCLSVNYKRIHLTCELNRKSDKTGRTPDKFTVYMDRTDIQQVWSDEADGDDTSMCPHTTVKLSSGQKACVISECGEPPVVAHGSVSVYKVGVAEQTVYACDTGYFLGVSLNNKSTCKADGTFTAVEFVCETLQCAAPSSMVNAMYTMYRQGLKEKAVYTCNTHYYMTGPGNGTLMCNVDNTFPAADFSCPAIQCPNPPSVSNAQLKSKSTNPGGEASYDCDFGFLSWQPTVISCILGGTWSTVSFECLLVGFG